MYELHLIASKPSHGDRHVNPDATARLIDSFDTKSEARAAGKRYLRENPEAWVQVQDDQQREPAEDVQ
jgi:hypothetical protein